MTETTIVNKRGKNFVAESISKYMRMDYEAFLYGHVTIDFVCKKHGETKHRVTRIFNMLFHERITQAQTSKQ